MFTFKLVEWGEIRAFADKVGDSCVREGEVVSGIDVVVLDDVQFIRAPVRGMQVQERIAVRQIWHWSKIEKRTQK